MTLIFVLGVKNYPRLVWYEPTSTSKATKIFDANVADKISFISPNLYEMRAIASAATGKNISSSDSSSSSSSSKDIIEEMQGLVQQVSVLIRLWFVATRKEFRESE